MLNEALQRNAKHEARLSNISGYWLGERLERNNLRFFAPLRMTACRISNEAEQLSERERYQSYAAVR
jgi:hypothetical protein